MKVVIVSMIFRAVGLLNCFLWRGNDVLILDIDNTIANSYQSLKGNTPRNGVDRIRAIKPKKQVIIKLKELYPYHKILFLSARSYSHFFETYWWLKRSGFNISILQLILVKKPTQKIWYLRKFALASSVVYFDDMSYNQERGLLKFYDKVIREVESLNLEYHGYNKIKELEIEN